MDTKSPFIKSRFDTLEEMAKTPERSRLELRKFLLNFLMDYKYFRTPYSMHFGGLYRARKEVFTSIDEACRKFSNVSELSYPRDSRVITSSGRCNAQGHAVFYCSNENGVPIFEIRPNEGEYIVVTFFRHKSNKNFDVILPIIGVKQLRENLLRRDPDNEMIKILSDDMHYKDNTDPIRLEIDDHIANWFSTKVDDSNRYIYKLTHAFFDMLIKDIRFFSLRFRALIYPSVESEITGYNIVMEPGLADTLTVEKAIIYHVEYQSGKNYRLRALKENASIDQKGNITWRESDDKTKTFDLSPKIETLTFSANEVLAHPRVNQ